ncbi:MAG: hypothetical protein JNL44_02725 [Gemmatimonadetes bacterium]|nr:hypothetical protein [Gemmatimonadota bacterium]
MRRSLRWALVAMIVPVAIPLGAQRPALIKLKPASGQHPEEFTTVFALRELADGRVLVSDSRENRLVVLDFRTGVTKAVGRTGRGPNEYSRAATLFALGADSTLMPDPGSRRWLILAKDSIVVTVPPDDRAVLAVDAFPRAADARGNLLARRERAITEAPIEETTSRDSSAFVMVDRARARQDTIAWAMPLPRRTQQTKNAKGEITSMSVMPIGVLGYEESGTLFPDGWFAIARHRPFRVDWRSPNGTWTKGAPLPVAPIRVDARERSAYMERNAENYRPRPELPPEFALKPPTPADFPDIIPPFPSGTGSLIAGPDGVLIIRRTKSADFPASNYFFVDRQGKLLGELALPANETVVGAGQRTLYIAVKDEDDILRLRRHPW